MKAKTAVLLFPVIFLAIILFIWLLIPLFIGLIRLRIAKDKTFKDDFEVEKLKKGDIVLTGKQSIKHSSQIQLANVLTRKLHHRFWTHAAIYIGDDQLIEAQPDGIRRRDIREYVKEGYYIRAFRHRYLHNDLTINNVIQACKSKIGSNYDTKGALFYGLSILFPVGMNFMFKNQLVDQLCQVENSYFCSELIVEAFEEAGFPISPFDGWRVKPSDFIGNPLLTDVEM